MTTLDVKIRGIRTPLPSGHVIGRIEPGVGDAHLISIVDLASHIEATGVSAAGGAAVMPVIGSGHVLGNAGAGSAAATDTTLTALIDRALGSTQGDVLYRGASAWTVLAPGTSGQFLKTQGASANPTWATLPADTDTLAGLSDVQITSVADLNILYYKNADGKWENTTLSALLDAVIGSSQGAIITRGSSVWKVLNPGAANTLLASAGASADLAYTTLSTLIDTVFGSAQGDILYRGASNWTVLAPGTSGNFLKTQGASANPVWSPTGGSGGGSGGLFSQVLSATPTDANTGLTNWVNQGTASFSNSLTGFCITAPNTGTFSVRALTKAVSGNYTTPYKITALYAIAAAANNIWGGIGWYDGTKFHLYGPITSGSLFQLLVGKVTNSTTYSANDSILGLAYPPLVWLRIGDDGTNVTFEFSFDGSNFITQQTTAKSAAFLGSGGYTNIAFFAEPQGGALQSTLLSFS